MSEELENAQATLPQAAVEASGQEAQRADGAPAQGQASEEPAAKPKRRGRKKAAEADVPAEPAAAPELAAAGADAPAKKAPARRRTAAGKAADAAASDAAASAAATSAEGLKAATAGGVATAGAPDGSETAGQGALSQNASVADREAPKKVPARRGRPRRKPVEAEPASAQEAPQGAVAGSAATAAAGATGAASDAAQAGPAAAAEGSEAPAAAKPARRTRVARAGKTAPAVAAEAAASDGAASAEAPEASAGAATSAHAAAVDSSPAAAEGHDAASAQEAPQGAEPGAAQNTQPAPTDAPAGRVRRERSNNNGINANNKKRAKQNQMAQSDKNNAPSQGQNQGQQNQGKNNNNKGAFDRDHRRQRRQHGNREVLPSISRDEFAEMKVGDLREKAAEYGIDASGYRKAELIDVVFEALCKAEGIIEVEGILDIMNDGYGFLRTKGYLPSESDAYVSLSIIRRNGLRKGDYLVGLTRPAQGNEKYAAIQKVISVNDIPADELGGRVRFADLTPIYPDERLIMEHGKSTTTARVIDLVSPIGKGQRGLIVSPPKAGKTTVLKDIAAAISANNPEVHLMCLLVDERPEEVTDMERSIKGEVISSTFDKPCENHIAVAELVIERAKRLVEQGRDVVILLDSITRLARAYNMGTPASGRILSGGVDSSALYPPKRFLGAARNIENGGSLTILGTALVDTGSKMDEVIFEEFKGTGNMELKLDRSLADKRIFPAIDPITSGTRKEELLLDPQEAPLIWAVRRVLANLNNTERAMDTLVKSIKQTETNQEFLIRFARKAQNSSKQDSLDL